MHDAMPRPAAVRFGLAAALILAGLYGVAILWSPVTNWLPAAVFLCAFLGLRRGNAWSGYGAAAFLASGILAMITSEIRVNITPPAGVAAIILLGGLFALLLFRAGRALPSEPAGASRAVWLTLSAATFLFLYTFKPFVVPSVAMENTILLGDYLSVRIAGPLTPARGDIVVHRFPKDPKQIYVKRVVAVGGDRLHFHDKTLVLNGAPLSEPYAVHKTEYIDAFRDNFPGGDPGVRDPWISELPSHVVNGDLLVPAGKYFVLGDNRDDSLDSRYWGFVDPSAIIGKPVFRYFSADVPSAELNAPQQPATPILFTPGRIRWGRLFQPIR
jgi:signal peptidase I